MKLELFKSIMTKDRVSYRPQYGQGETYLSLTKQQYLDMGSPDQLLVTVHLP